MGRGLAWEYVAFCDLLITDNVPPKRPGLQNGTRASVSRSQPGVQIDSNDGWESFHCQLVTSPLLESERSTS